MIKPIDVVLADANDGHAELAEHSLRESGIVRDFYRGHDGRETLEFVRRACRGGTRATYAGPLVLLDCGLPLIGGVGVVSTLRGDRQYRSVPIIMMTTAYSRRQAEEYKRLGCDYVTKWAVFLGLAGFLRSSGYPAKKAMWGASCSSVAGGSQGCHADTRGPGSIFDAARSRRCRAEQVGKEVTDESATS